MGVSWGSSGNAFVEEVRAREQVECTSGKAVTWLRTQAGAMQTSQHGPVPSTAHGAEVPSR